MKVPKTIKDFALLLDEVDPCVSVVVVDEADEISTPANAHILCSSPHIRIDKIEPVPTLILLIGEWKPMLLLELASFRNLALLTTKL